MRTENASPTSTAAEPSGGAPLPAACPERPQIVDEGAHGFVWSPAPGVFCGRLAGNVPRGCIEHYIAAMEQVGREHMWLDVFHDWFDVKSYEPEVRSRLTSWANERHQRMPGTAHVLFSSKVLAMGLTLANVVLRRKLSVYANRSVFDDVLRSATNATIAERRARLAR